MNLKKLIAAAKEIDRLAAHQDERLRQISELEARARQTTDPKELREIQEALRYRSIVGVDFSLAIKDIRRALKARNQQSKTKRKKA